MVRPTSSTSGGMEGLYTAAPFLDLGQGYELSRISLVVLFFTGTQMSLTPEATVKLHTISPKHLEGIS